MELKGKGKKKRKSCSEEILKAWNRIHIEGSEKRKTKKGK